MVPRMTTSVDPGRVASVSRSAGSFRMGTFVPCRTLMSRSLISASSIVASTCGLVRLQFCRDVMDVATCAVSMQNLNMPIGTVIVTAMKLLRSAMKLFVVLASIRVLTIPLTVVLMPLLDPFSVPVVAVLVFLNGLMLLTLIVSSRWTRVATVLLVFAGLRVLLRVDSAILMPLLSWLNTLNRFTVGSSCARGV